MQSVHSVACKWPVSLWALIYFSVCILLCCRFDLKPVACSNSLHFLLSMHKSVTCIDRNNDGFVHQRLFIGTTFILWMLSWERPLCWLHLRYRSSIVKALVYHFSLWRYVIYLHGCKAVSATFHSSLSCCVLRSPLVAGLARALLIHLFSFLHLVALQAMNDLFAFLKRNVRYLSNRQTA